MPIGKSAHCRLLACGLVAALAASSPASLHADIYRPGDNVREAIGTVFSWTQGDQHSTFSGWNTFDESVFGTEDDPASPPHVFEPDVGSFGTPSSLSLNTAGSFVTSGGNLYSFSVAQDFTATINSGTSGGSNTRIVSQFRTLGTELDYDSILLSEDLGAAGSRAPDMMVETERVALGGFGGTEVDYLAVWDLPTSQEAFRLDFNAAGSSLSLDQFYVDTFTQDSPFVTPTAIPEPASFAALGVFGVSAFGVARLRRRRKAAMANA